MRWHFAIVLSFFILGALPCSAQVSDVGRLPPATSISAFDDPVFVMEDPAKNIRRGPMSRIFTLPNIAVVLAGLAWMALARRVTNQKKPDSHYL